MEEITKIIEEAIHTAHKEIEKVLDKVFPNLYFYIAPSGELSCWIRNSLGRGGAGVRMDTINVKHISPQQWNYLTGLELKAAIVNANPDSCFYCSECGKVKPITEFEEAVFAGWYCKECAKKPSLAALIEESHKRGFYD